MSTPPKSKARLLVPEVVQTSAMDCGPASLKALLDGFGIPVSYGRLREACQTDVDGTSIDTLEETAVQLGLDAEQIMIPVDHLLIPEAQALPALVVIRQPNGVTHFVVAWRRVGRFIQLMDPGTGRQWTSTQRFLDNLYVHQHLVPAQAWRDWAGSDDFTAVLLQRQRALKVPDSACQTLLNETLADAGWHPLAALDAATRMVTALVEAGGIRPGREAARVWQSIFREALEETPGVSAIIPQDYWSVRPGPDDEDGEAQLWLRGAVLIRVRGRRAAQPQPGAEPTLSPELAAALQEPPSRPGRDLLRLLQDDGLFGLTMLASALALASGGIVIEALLFRGLIDISAQLGLAMQRIGAMVALLLFAIALLGLEVPIASGLLRRGRHLENRLRVAFLRKIPKLGDRYFQSRLSSDMAERSHSVQRLRQLTGLGGRGLRAVFELLLTTVGIIWLDPSGWWLALLAAAIITALPVLMQPILAERDLRVRTHSGALGRFYLDALLGLTAIRAHGAEQAVRREHEGLLVEWARAGLNLQWTVVFVEGLQVLAGYGLAVALLLSYLGRYGASGSVLLLVYWALRLPALGEEIALVLRLYPVQRNTALRLMEPLGAPEEDAPLGVAVLTRNGQEDDSAPVQTGVALSFENVSVRAAGHVILDGLTLSIEAGSHVAVVGSSGAGKSTMVGLLLGWHRAATGQMLVDGLPMTTTTLAWLRRNTAWVDPAIHIWNRSLLENLRYGTADKPLDGLGRTLATADLHRVLQRMPDGLQTPLGEGGSFVSGGEGQRIRYARSLLRPEARLVILDEPFRGLDRGQRRRLMARARRHWPHATLICITHDLQETLEFNRVLVVEQGRIVEDDRPSALMNQPDSRYRALMDADAVLRKNYWASETWRTLYLDAGRVREGVREKME